MKISSKNLHAWDVTPKEAIAIQRRLREKRWREADLDVESVRTIAGIDSAYLSERKKALAVIAVMSFPDLQPREEAQAVVPITFPYVPGLLTWREGPAILAAWAKLERRPDLLLFDGQGIAHPRRLGIASHMGILLDTPSIGVAKTRLVGEYSEPGPKRGQVAELCDNGETIGMVVRTRDGVQPVFVSIGHKITLGTAVELVLDCCTVFRLPEPIRRAHLSANRLKPSA